MKDPQSIKQGDPVTKDWRTINEVIASNAELRSYAEMLEFRLARLERQPLIRMGSGEVQQLVVTVVKRDYLVCRSLSIGATGTRTMGETDIEVAKPYEFRYSSFASKTIGNHTYSAYTGTEVIGTEADQSGAQIRNVNSVLDGTDDHAVTEYVYPAWISKTETVPGSVIYAAKVTGTLTVGELTGETWAINKTVTWCDVNADARRWRQKYRDVYFCLDGVTKRIRVESSAAFDPPDPVEA